MAELDIEKLREQWREKVERMPTKVVYEAPWIRFLIDRKVVQERQLSDLSRIYEVFSGTDLWATDREFAVLDFGDCLWVVPNTTPIGLIYPEWSDWVIENRAYFNAYIGGIPLEWLNPPFLGIRFGSALPVAGVYPINSLPAWSVEGPLDPRVSPAAPLP
ncbi:hypothetical protein [Granulicella arctica]|uniref:Uncharacterized protein n=1 Tax=Granulicella arctica TaxID=940613 RepID=A0A7Y9PGM7_9BACT|nr:hypothetical protein [Granulicella arctica]NYF78801.1 hypothetical protein [Granulicella arctica]